MLDFAIKNYILSPRQYGFRKKLSAIDAILSFLEYLMEVLEDHKKVSALFCDLSKAFDTVSHRLLLDKLLKYGYRDNINNLFESYLQHRKQKSFPIISLV